MGLTASLSSKSGILVEGEANPQAYVLQRWNPLLALGTHPFAAMGTHYIAAEPDRLFRREIGEFVAIEGEGRSEPRSEIQDFRKLADLVHRFHRARLGHSPSGNQALYAEMLDAIFVENEAALNAVARHHATAPREGPVYDYKASQLTRYGRLVHDDRGKPLIETSFALLHYEKALHEFDSLKLATTAGNLERRYMHGVYCVVAIAACMESVANFLMFHAKDRHEKGMDPGSAIGRVNFAARQLASNRGSSYNSLGGKRTEYQSMEQVRVLRNSFMHASESGEPIDETILTSAQLASIDEGACRGFLRDLRLTVSYVFDQLPWIGRPINTATHVKWLGEMEVP